MAISFCGNLEYLSAFLHNSSVYSFTMELSSILFRRGIFYSSRDIFNCWLNFYLWLFFLLLCTFPLYQFFQTCVRHCNSETGFLYIFNKFGKRENCSSQSTNDLCSCCESLGYSIRDSLGFRSSVFFYLGFHAPIDESHTNPPQLTRLETEKWTEVIMHHYVSHIWTETKHVFGNPDLTFQTSTQPNSKQAYLRMLRVCSWRNWRRQ